MADWIPSCRVFLVGNEDPYDVPPEEYEALKDRVEHQEPGWVELPLAEHPSGRVLLRPTDVQSLYLRTEDVCDALRLRQARGDFE